MIDTVFHYLIKWTDAFSLRKASLLVRRIFYVISVNIILQLTSTSIEVFCIEGILQHFLGTSLFSRFHVERK